MSPGGKGASIARERVAVPTLNDARSVRSQAALRQALLDLMETVPFDRITLRDIMAGAKVSAPTFYRHYTTKEDLLTDIAREEIESFMAMSFPAPRADGRSPGEGICAFVDARRQKWRVLLPHGALGILREEFIRQAQERARRGPRLNPRFPGEVMAAVVASGLFEIIAWWLHQPADYPQAEVAQMLEQLVINPVTRPS